MGTDDTGLTPWQSDRKGVLKDVRSAYKAPKKERQITEVWSYFRSRPKKKRDGCRLGRPAVKAEPDQRLRKERAFFPPFGSGRTATVPHHLGSSVPSMPKHGEIDTTSSAEQHYSIDQRAADTMARGSSSIDDESMQVDVPDGMDFETGGEYSPARNEPHPLYQSGRDSSDSEPTRRVRYFRPPKRFYKRTWRDLTRKLWSRSLSVEAA